jgi:hypothetical protein
MYVYVCVYSRRRCNYRQCTTVSPQRQRCHPHQHHFPYQCLHAPTPPPTHKCARLQRCAEDNDSTLLSYRMNAQQLHFPRYIHIYIYIYISVYLYAYVYIHIYIYIYICISVYLYAYVYIYICVCVCVCLCLYMYIYIYIYTYIHTGMCACAYI